MIGFYRTYVRDAAGVGRFTPEDPEAQKALGRKIMQVFQRPGRPSSPRISAPSPTSSAQSLQELGVPGYKVFRWERAWKTDGHPFLDPRHYAALSVTTTGTHDTESLAEWWDTASHEERIEALKVPDLAAAGFTADSPFDDRLRDALLAAIYPVGREPRACCRCRTSSAGAIGSTCPAPSAPRTGRGGCRFPSASC